MIRLSVNINKIATIRNARGGNIPSVIKAAKAIENFGAHGITIHPRPDQRHITRQDVYELKEVVNTELNIEGYPSDEFLKMVKEVHPEQVTLVPDGPDVLTSNSGWDCITNQDYLKKIVADLSANKIRVSIFLDPDIEQVKAAKQCGTDCIELYTENYASSFYKNAAAAVQPYVTAAEAADNLGLLVNAGHDLDLDNLHFFVKHIPFLAEVSIGHALISDSLYYGLSNTVQMYLSKLNVE